MGVLAWLVDLSVMESGLSHCLSNLQENSICQSEVGCGGGGGWLVVCDLSETFPDRSSIII